MSDVSLRTKALALIECSGKSDCKGCTWEDDDEVCEAIHRGKFLMSDTGKILNELLEENEILRERIAIMEVEREDDLK